MNIKETPLMIIITLYKIYVLKAEDNIYIILRYMQVLFWLAQVKRTLEFVVAMFCVFCHMLTLRNGINYLLTTGTREILQY